MELRPASKSTFQNLWRPHARHWRQLLPRIIIAIAIYMVLDKTLILIADTSAGGYHQPFVPGEILKNVFTRFYLVLLALLIIPFILRKLLLPWSAFEKGKAIRILLFSAALMLSWKYVTADYNYYLDNWYLPDRILLIILTFLILSRPFFLLPFLVALLTIIGQYQLLPVYSLAAESLLFRSQILFMSFFIIRVFTNYFSYEEFIFLIGCLLGAHYFESGILKINPEWLLYDNIPYLLPNIYTSGWLSHLSPEDISYITRSAGWVNVPIKLYTITIECGMLLIFLNLRFTRFLLAGAIIFHLGIFLMTGIFFWMWILFLFVILVYVFNRKDARIRLLFSRSYLLLSLPLIALGEFWCDPVGLAWHDSTMNYTYKFQAEMDNGTRQLLPPEFFSPYYYQFTLGNFKYLSPDKLLPVVWGATNATTSRGLRNSPTISGALAYEQKAGRRFQDPDKKIYFEGFVQQFVGNWNSKRDKHHYINYLQPPRLLLNFPTKSIVPADNKIVTIRVLEITSYYSHAEGYKVIRSRNIGQIAIPPLNAASEQVQNIKSDRGF